MTLCRAMASFGMSPRGFILRTWAAKGHFSWLPWSKVKTLFLLGSAASFGSSLNGVTWMGAPDFQRPVKRAPRSSAVFTAGSLTRGAFSSRNLSNSGTSCCRKRKARKLPSLAHPGRSAWCSSPSRPSRMTPGGTGGWFDRSWPTPATDGLEMPSKNPKLVTELEDGHNWSASSRLVIITT